MSEYKKVGKWISIQYLLSLAHLFIVVPFMWIVFQGEGGIDIYSIVTGEFIALFVAASIAVSSYLEYSDSLEDDPKVAHSKASTLGLCVILMINTCIYLIYKIESENLFRIDVAESDLAPVQGVVIFISILYSAWFRYQAYYMDRDQVGASGVRS